MVVGSGRIDGRRVAVQGDDFTVRGGAADAAIWQKMVWAERYAHDMRVPLVRLVDGTGGGGSVKTLETMGFSYVPPLPGFELVVANLSRVPVVAAALGPVAGLGAARVVTSHFSLIVRGTAQLFVAGPPVVAAAMGESPDKEQLGGSRAQTRAGAVDNEAADEEDAFEQIRRFLSYLPANAWEAPPAARATTRPSAGRRSCCRWSRATAAARTRCARSWTRCWIAARVSRSAPARALGDHRAGAVGRSAGRSSGVRSQPLRRRSHARPRPRSWRALSTLCDQFHLPVVNFVDQPGFVIGSDAEQAGTIRRGARALDAVHQAQCPGCRSWSARSSAWPAPGTATARG